MQLERVALVLKSAHWTVEVPLAPRRPIVPSLDLLELRGPATPPSCASAPRPLRATLTVETDEVALLGMRSPIRVIVANDDDRRMEVTGDALLQPGDDDEDALEHSDATPSRALNAIPFGTIDPGSTLSLDLALFCASVPGRRLVDLVVRCVPANEAGQTEAAPIELARSMQIDARPALLADVGVRWLRRMHVPRGMADMTKPGPMDESWLAAISVHLTVDSPWAVEIIDVRPEHAVRIACVSRRLMRQVSAHFRLLSSSLAAEQLPVSASTKARVVAEHAAWQPGHRFALVMTAQVAESHALGAESILIDLRRSGTAAAPSTARIALPAVAPPPLLPRVAVAVPPSIAQHCPTPLAYRIFNPSRRRLLRLSVHLDGADGFVFAGPRRTGAFTVLPNAEHVVRVVVIAVGQTGEVALPRLRVFEHVRPGEETQAKRVGAAVGAGDGQDEAQAVLRELPIAVENADGAGRALSVTVVPN